jgi:hypothetical protein
MGTVAFINPGEVSSAGKINRDLLTIQQLGTAILAQLSDIQTSTLIDYERRLSALALRQSRAAKVLPSNIAAQFTLSDWTQINQTDTTATVRVDTQTATLREKRLPSTVLVSNTAFTTSVGTVAALDQNQTLYRVTANSAPTVTFTLTLSDTVQLNLMTFTLSALASTPEVTVSTSADNVVFTPATNVEVVGSTLNAWLPSNPVLYVRLLITPTHADNLGGNTYTFGITGATGTSVSYALVSDLYFQPVPVVPLSASWTLVAPADPGLKYFCRLTGTGFDSGYIQYQPGDVISVPGIQQGSAQSTDNGQGLINGPINGVTLPYGIYETIIGAVVYPWSLTVGLYNPITQITTNLPILWTNFNFTDAADITTLIGNNSEQYAPFTTLSRTYAVAQLTTQGLTSGGGVSTVYILPPNFGSDGNPTQFVTNWSYGPSEVNIEFYVHISTSDRNKTPVFTGLSLEAN